MLILERLSKVYPTTNGSTTALDQISFQVAAGECWVVLGQPGSGRSALLKSINRLVEPSSGRILFQGQDVTSSDVVDLRRRIGYLGYPVGLFPHRNVTDNIALVPRLLGWPEPQVQARVMALLEWIELDPAIYATRSVHHLVGSQAERVGLARAVAAEPALLLLDEPFTGLPFAEQRRFRQRVLDLQQQGMTLVISSSDVDETIQLAHQVVFLREGRIEQQDAPMQLLAKPNNGFVADFLGQERVFKRLGLVSVSQAMDDSPPRVQAEDRLDLAAEIMVEQGYDQLVLVGPRGRARGAVSLAVARTERGTCGEYRSGLKATTRVDDTLRTAVALMFTHGVTWLACVDDDGFYRGFLSQRRVTQFLAEMYQEQDG